MPQPRRTRQTDAPDPAPKAAAKVKDIVRQTDMAWWCPCCDHSQVTTTDECANCGAQRRGDTVTIPVREAA